MKGGPSDGVLTPRDRIVKIGDVDITTMVNADAMAILGAAVNARTTFLELTVKRQTAARTAMPLSSTVISAAAVSSSLSAHLPPASSASALACVNSPAHCTRSKTTTTTTPTLLPEQAPALQLQQEQHAASATHTTASMPAPAPTPAEQSSITKHGVPGANAIASVAPAAASAAAASRKRKALNQSSRLGASFAGNVSYIGLKNVLARAHRKNKLMDALLKKPTVADFNRGVGVGAGAGAAIPPPPAYPTSDLTMLRGSVEPTNLSAINDVSGRWSRCSSADIAHADGSQELSIFLGKKIKTLGVRLVGTRSHVSGDGGIFVGRKKSEGPENRALLSVGDHVLQVNGVDITEMSNRSAIETIERVVKEAGSGGVTLTVMRFAETSTTTTTTTATTTNNKNNNNNNNAERQIVTPASSARKSVPDLEMGWV